MKRNNYWYLYQFYTTDDDRRELLFYGTSSQVSGFSMRFGTDYNMCKCSKAVACSLSHDIGLPIYDVSNLEELNEMR